jgi:hypothetical protein
LPFAGLAALWTWRTLKQPRAALALALTLLATISPWIVRNSLLTRKLTGIETSMGYNLYVGYHPTSTGAFTFGPSLDLLSILDEKQREEIGMQRALGFIRENPGRFPYLALRRLGYFFNLELRGFTYFYENNLLGHLPPTIQVLCFALLSVPFMVVSISRHGRVRYSCQPANQLLALLFIGYLLPHVFILSEERFHLAMIPAMAILAARAWTAGRSVLHGSRAQGALAAAVIGLLLINWGLELARDGSRLLLLLGPNGNELYAPY